MKALITKVRPNSISEGIMKALMRQGYIVETFPEDLDIREIEDSNFEIDPDTEVFVNTVGVTQSGNIGAWTNEKAGRIISTNLTGAIALTSAFLKATAGKSPKKKHIFHIGSLWSRKHATDGAVYCASKAGLAHYIACAGYDIKNRISENIFITGIHPGNVIGTPLSLKVRQSMIQDRGMSPSKVDDIYKGCITPEEIGNLLCSMINNKWVNGENIYLGGGDKR